MLYVNFKKYICLGVLFYLFSSILFATDSYAVFENLTTTGWEIFAGMRKIIFAASGFGILAIAIGGFFGALNWKWLSAIIIGLVVIATTVGIIRYMSDGIGGGQVNTSTISDTLVYAE